MFIHYWSLLLNQSVMPDNDQTLLPVGKKVLIVLWTFYKSMEQVPLLFNKFQIKFINEQLQCWITLYHLTEYLPL